MQMETVVRRLLGLQAALVTKATFHPDALAIVVGVELRRKSLECSRCGHRSTTGGYDSRSRMWRHIDLGPWEVVRGGGNGWCTARPPGPSRRHRNAAVLAVGQCLDPCPHANPGRAAPGSIDPWRCAGNVTFPTTPSGHVPSMPPLRQAPSRAWTPA